MTICHVNKIREENKTSNSPWNLTLHCPLGKLTTILGNKIKCAIIQITFYTPAVAKTYKELYVSQVSGLSLTGCMQRNWS